MVAREGALEARLLLEGTVQRVVVEVVALDVGDLDLLEEVVERLNIEGRLAEARA